MTHAELVDALRQVDGLRDKGKVHPAFYYQSRAFHDEYLLCAFHRLVAARRAPTLWESYCKAQRLR